MTLKYEKTKEFSGVYGKTTMLIFTDNLINRDNCDLIKKIIKIYKGHNGEFIDYKILYDETNYIYQIIVIVLCFKTLLDDVSKKEYNNFIKMHKNQFMEYYNKVVPILVG